MKKLNLKMGGIKEMLSKEQMKSVVGGYGYGYGGDFCTFRMTDPQGHVTGTINSVWMSNGSSGANSYCVSYISNAPQGTRCAYDCMADGWGH
jgi:hypothetical protein